MIQSYFALCRCSINLVRSAVSEISDSKFRSELKITDPNSSLRIMEPDNNTKIRILNYPNSDKSSNLNTISGNGRPRSGIGGEGASRANAHSGKNEGGWRLKANYKGQQILLLPGVAK
ncbi:hypothetical protein Trydic_g7598 [Trypoxylus dichotomus]